MPIERWRRIEGYEGYEISDLGRFKSKRFKDKFLKTVIGEKGYELVSLYRDKKLVGGIGVARLMALAFIPREFGLDYVNHINGIKSDNRLSNLEWVDNRTNIIHAVATGLKPTKLKEAQVLEILEKASRGESQVEIAKKYSVNQSSISKILSGKNRIKTLEYAASKN